MLVSFIIPSYNSAQSVGRCLDSIYALSLRSNEFEIIFIDDCSTDNTCDVVSEYKTHHKNITFLQQPKNNRQGAARNRGISVAKGSYICFVDSDDVVMEGVVSAIRIAHDQQTDMTAFHYGYANEYGDITKEKEHLIFSQGQLFSGVELQNVHPYWCSGPVAYVYSTRFISEVNYPFCEGVLYEDSDFVSNHLYRAQKMAYSPNLGYIVYCREGSTTHSNNYKNIADYFLLGSRMLTLYVLIQHDIESGKCSDDGVHKFADGVLEGAIYNITISLKRLLKVDDLHGICAFYNRIDAHVNRRALYQDKRLYKYPNYWNFLTYIGIRYKYISIPLNICLAIFYKAYCKLKYLIQ